LVLAARGASLGSAVGLRVNMRTPDEICLVTKRTKR